MNKLLMIFVVVGVSFSLYSIHVSDKYLNKFIGSSISKNDIAKLDTISRNLRKMLNSKKIDMDLFEMAVEGIEFIVKTNKK